MRIASFNVENLFDRARTLNQQTWAPGQANPDQAWAGQRASEQTLYSAADKQKTKDLLLEFGLEKRDVWHLGGVPAAQASSWLGHSAQEHLRTYAHAVLDRTEIDYGRAD